MTREPTNEELYEAYPRVSSPPSPDEVRGRSLERRVAHLEASRPQAPAASPTARYAWRFALAVITLGAGVPLSFVAMVAGMEPNLAALAIIWVGLVGINVVFDRASARRDDD